MRIGDFIASENVVARLPAASGRQALQALAGLAAKRLDLPEAVIFETLLERERLGSTGIGQGIAIPHGKFSGIDKLQGFFASLDRPIDFDAADAKPVDLFFMLLAPENAGGDHLQALASISRRLEQAGVRRKLRACKSPASLHAALTKETQTAAKKPAKKK